MLKWLVVIVLVLVVSALWESRPGRRLRLGELPGDVVFRVGRRTLRLPFTSTILLSCAAWALLRLL